MILSSDKLTDAVFTKRTAKLVRHSRNLGVYPYGRHPDSVELSRLLVMADSVESVSLYGQLQVAWRIDALEPGTYDAQLRGGNLHLSKQTEGGDHWEVLLDLVELGWATAARWTPGDGQSGQPREGWKAFELTNQSRLRAGSLSHHTSTLDSARNSILLRKSSSPSLLQLSDATNRNHPAPSTPPTSSEIATSAHEPPSQPNGDKEKSRRKLADRFRGKRGKSISAVASILEDSTPPPPLPTSASLSSCPTTPGPPSLILLAPDIAACEAWIDSLNTALLTSAPPSGVPTWPAGMVRAERPGMVTSGSLPVGLNAALGGNVSRSGERSITAKLLGRRPMTAAGLTTELPAGFNPDRRPSFLDRPPPSPSAYTRPAVVTNSPGGCPGPLSAPIGFGPPVTRGHSSAASGANDPASHQLERRGSLSSLKSPELKGRRSFTFGTRSPEPSSSSPHGAGPMPIPIERNKATARSPLGHPDQSTLTGHKFFGLLGKKSKKDPDVGLLSSSASTTGSFEVLRRTGGAQVDLVAAADPHQGAGLGRTAPNGLPYARPSEDTSCSGHSADTDSLFSGSLHTTESSVLRPVTPTLAEMGVGLEAAWPAQTQAQVEDEGGKTPKASKDHFARDLVLRRETLEVHRTRMPTIDSVDGGLNEPLERSFGREGPGEWQGEGRIPTRRGSSRSSASGSTRRSVSTGRDPSQRVTADDYRQTEALSPSTSTNVREEPPRLYERRGVLGGGRTVSISGSKGPAPKSLSTPPAVPYSPFAGSTSPGSKSAPIPSPGFNRRHTHQPHQAFLSPQPSPHGSDRVGPRSPSFASGSGGRPVSLAPLARPITPGVVEHIVAPVQLLEQMREEQRTRSAEKERRAGAGPSGLRPPPLMARSHSAGVGGRGVQGLAAGGMVGLTPVPFEMAVSLNGAKLASVAMRKAASAPIQSLPLGPDAPRRGSFGLQSCGPLVMDPAEDDVRSFTLEELSAVGVAQAGVESDSDREEEGRRCEVREGRSVLVC